ncbi:MAG: DUF7347 domain-containing protein [Promethearchaeota archaeon]
MQSSGKKDPLEIVESKFATLSSKIRIQILRVLELNPMPMNFNNLQKILSPLFSKSFNLSYHLSLLVEANFIEKIAEGYQLTNIGKKIIPKLQDFENIFTDQSKIMVRTSKYSLEPFNEMIIAQNLIKEAGMSEDDAIFIAQEAKKRLNIANITFLTTPLIREYINAILIENQMEEYRHKLTRLGQPPYDINQLINSNTLNHPKILQSTLGSNVLEQYMLLNQLKQKVTTNFHLGAFIFSDLAHFSLTPMECLISGNNLNKTLQRFYELNNIGNITKLSNSQKENVWELDFASFLDNIKGLTEFIQPFFPAGLVIFRFDEFVGDFLEKYTILELEELLYYGFGIKENSELPIGNNPVFETSLGISFNGLLPNISPILEIYLKSLNKPIEKWQRLPVLQIHLSKNEVKKILGINKTDDNIDPRLEVLAKIFPLFYHHQVNIDQFSKRGNANTEMIWSNLQVPMEYSNAETRNTSIILEKISLNLLDIYKKSNNNEKDFFMNLQNRIFNVFVYFEQKFHLLSKNLDKFSNWKKIQAFLFNNVNIFSDYQDMQDYSGEISLICGISIYGLDEIACLRSKYFLKDLVSNREFAIKILQFIQDLLKKQNLILSKSISYQLSQPHLQKGLIQPSNFTKLQDIHRPHEELRSYQGYSFDFHTTSHQLKSSHLLQIYSEFGSSKLPQLSGYYPLPKDFPKKNNWVWIETLQKLLQTNLSRISCSQTNIFLKNETQKFAFSRYFGPYLSFKNLERKFKFRFS